MFEPVQISDQLYSCRNQIRQFLWSILIFRPHISGSCNGSALHSTFHFPFFVPAFEVEVELILPRLYSGIFSFFLEIGKAGVILAQLTFEADDSRCCFSVPPGKYPSSPPAPRFTLIQSILAYNREQLVNQETLRVSLACL